MSLIEYIIYFEIFTYHVSFNDYSKGQIYTQSGDKVVSWYQIWNNHWMNIIKVALLKSKRETKIFEDQRQKKIWFMTYSVLSIRAGIDKIQNSNSTMKMSVTAMALSTIFIEDSSLSLWRSSRINPFRIKLNPSKTGIVNPYAIHCSSVTRLMCGLK